MFVEGATGGVSVESVRAAQLQPGGAHMGDKSPKANDKKKKQDAAGKSQKKAAPATKAAPAPPPAKKGK